MSQKQSVKVAWKLREFNKNPHCRMCGVRMLKPGTFPADYMHPTLATIDHIFPRSRGGKDNRRNWRLTCWACNNEKADSVAAD